MENKAFSSTEWTERPSLQLVPSSEARSEARRGLGPATVLRAAPASTGQLARRCPPWRCRLDTHATRRRRGVRSAPRPPHHQRHGKSKE